MRRLAMWFLAGAVLACSPKASESSGSTPPSNIEKLTSATLPAGDTHCPAGGYLLTFNDGTSADVCNGQNGAQGVKGDTGLQGATGAKGDTGSVGPQGQPGLVGIQGPTGLPGPTGPRGPGTPHVTDAAGYDRGYAYAIELSNYRQPSVLLAEQYPLNYTINTVFVWRNAITAALSPLSRCENYFSNVYYDGSDCIGNAYVVTAERLVPGIACFLPPPFPTHGDSAGHAYPVTTSGGAPVGAIAYLSTGIGPAACTNVGSATALLGAVQIVQAGDPWMTIIGAPPEMTGPLSFSP
jgi:hypothetical protein